MPTARIAAQKCTGIHFTGTGAGDILSCSGLSEKRRYHIGICDEIGLNVIDLAREIRLARPGYELFCRSILISVIASAVRALNTSSRHEHSHKYDKIKSVIDKMSICMNDTSTIQDYARVLYRQILFHHAVQRIYRVFSSRIPHND